jgi:hypothetical protein
MYPFNLGTNKDNIDGCNITIERHIANDWYNPSASNGANSVKTRIYKIVLPLADVDPLSIKEEIHTPFFYLQVNLTSPKRTVFYYKNFEPGKNIDNSNPYTGYTTKFRFEFTDKENFSRFKCALKHAVKLCDGKVDPF